MQPFLPIRETRNSAFPLVINFASIYRTFLLSIAFLILTLIQTFGQRENLVDNWQFDEGSGTTAVDASPTGGTMTEVTWGAWGGVAPATGSSGSRQLRNGGYMVVPDNAIYNSMATQMTIEAWVYPQNAGNNTIIDRANYNFLFQTHPNRQPVMGFYNPTGGWSYSTTAIPINTRFHVKVTLA